MIPASIRNNNPGAIYPGSSAKKFGSTSFEVLKSKDGTHKIATFPTSIHGAAALFDLLHNGRAPVTKTLRYRDQKLRDAIKTWCGDYHLPTYIKVVTAHCDVAVDDVLTTDLLRDPQRAIPLAKAMALQEAGRKYPLEDSEWLEAHELAFSGAEAPAWTPKNDVPTRNPEDCEQERRETIWMWLKRTVGGAFAAIGTYGVLGPTKFDIPAPPENLKQSFVHLGQWGDIVPFAQWQMLGLGAIVFMLVAGSSWLFTRSK